MIRFPGGYCYNKSSDFYTEIDDNAYRYKLSTDRHKLEQDLFTANPLMGKLPLVATVKRLRPDGKVEPAEGVAVYFQLVKVDDWPEDAAAAAKKADAAEAANVVAGDLAKKPTDPTLQAMNKQAQDYLREVNTAPPPAPLSSPPCPAFLLNKQMDYSKDWQIGELETTTPPQPLTGPQPWSVVKQIAKDAIKKPQSERDAFINTKVNEIISAWHPINRANVKADVKMAMNAARPAPLRYPHERREGADQRQSHGKFEPPRRRHQEKTQPFCQAPLATRKRSLAHPRG